MWKLKLPEGKDRWIFLLTVGVILCILAFPAGSKSSRMALSVSRSADEAVTASGQAARVLRLMSGKWRSGCGKFCGAFPVWERWM